MEKFWKFLDNIRNKPDHQKSMIALSCAAGITAVIAITWITIKVSTFSTEDFIVENDFRDSQTASPFESISEQFEVLGGQIEEIKEAWENEIEVEK